MNKKLDMLGAIGYFVLISVSTYVGIRYGFTQLVYVMGSIAWCFVTMLLYLYTLQTKYTNIIAGGAALMCFATFVAELMGQNTSLSEWHFIEAIVGVVGIGIAFLIQTIKKC